MNYAKKGLSQEDGISEVREPAVAAYAAGGRFAVEAEDEPWFDWDSVGGPEELKIHSVEHFKREVEKGLASLQAGLGIPHEEIEREFLREIESGVYGKI
jgi:hypothetical protein